MPEDAAASSEKARKREAIFLFGIGPSRVGLGWGEDRHFFGDSAPSRAVGEEDVASWQAT